jgi:MFS family permease
MPTTRTRFTLLRLTFALSIITYIDRVCVSTAAPDIQKALGLTPSQMGWVFSAFTIAYAAFEIPSGWLGDTLGPRKVLTRIVLWWSAFTVATGLVWNYVTLLIARFLFGAGEAGAFPTMSRSLSRWFPLRERGRAHGFISWDRGWEVRLRHCWSAPSLLLQDGGKRSGFSVPLVSSGACSGGDGFATIPRNIRR